VSDKNKDFTDFYMLFVNTGRTKEFKPAWEKLVEEAKDVREEFPELFEKETTVKKDYEDYEEVDFHDANDEKYINCPISFKAIVRGEGIKPYIYPIKVRITCNHAKGDKCMGCGMAFAGGKMDLKLDSINPLELIDINDVAKLSLIKRKVGIHQCGQFNLKILEQKYMQELFLSPIMQYHSDFKEDRFIVRHAFAEGADAIPNKTYDFDVIPTASPKNQSLVFYVKNHKKEESDLDNFKLKDPDKLKIFQPQDNTKIEERLKHIYDDLSVNVSPVIRFRNDIMLACDLAFHSVLNMNFGNSFERAYIECLIVGDTQSGKTKIASKLIQHYKYGVAKTMKNATVAGIIGGQTRFESVNIMSWGLLPLNHSRLVVLDEMSGAHQKLIEEMTSIRSEGIAERTIVGGSSSTPAKVRLIWLSNPRKWAVKDYDNGCKMVDELVGKNEDVSRFDYILTVAEDEVSSEKINSLRSSGFSYITKHVYKSELCNELISWAWSRKASNIIFDEDVEEFILYYAVEMSKRYTSNFKLVVGSTIRLKLAKIAIALAVRLFSTKDGENVFVTEHHVQFAYDWLNKIYNKPSFGYGDYSDFFKTGQDQTEDSKAVFVKFLNDTIGWENKKDFILNMLTNSKITAIEIADFSRLKRDNADKLRTMLVSNGLLVKREGYYIKSNLFIKVLKEELGLC
jgi:hypothetical protein